MIQQLLDEFTAMESSMEAETHITPLRASVAPSAADQAIMHKAHVAETSINVNAVESSAVKTIREEMLLTPELKSAMVLSGTKAADQGELPVEAGAAADVAAALETPVNNEEDVKHAEVSSCPRSLSGNVNRPDSALHVHCCVFHPESYAWGNIVTVSTMQDSDVAAHGDVTKKDDNRWIMDSSPNPAMQVMSLHTVLSRSLFSQH